MNRAPYPFGNCLLAGLRSRLYRPLVLRCKANLDYSPHRFALGQLGPSCFLSRLILLAQDF